MRHLRKKGKLSKPADQRKALLKSLVNGLFISKSGVITTFARAKELKKIAEKLITKAKQEDLNSRRQILKIINDKRALKNLLEVYVPKYKERNGGYLRVVKMHPRRGDGALMAKVGFVD